MTRICAVDGCDAAVKARDLCRRHYERLRVHGDPLTVHKRGGRKPPLPPGSQRVTCGDCGVVIAIVTTDEAVRAAIDNHTHTTPHHTKGSHHERRP